MTLHLHIKSLSLVGVKIPGTQKSQLRAVLEADLAQLFGTHGIPESLRQGCRIRTLPANLT